MESLAARVVRALRTPAYVKGINVTSGPHQVTAANLDFIAGLVKLGRIPVKQAALDIPGSAEYQGRGRNAPNSITFDNQVANSGDATYFASVAIHEATHAHQDWLRLRLTAVESERAAYLTQAMCLLNVRGADNIRGQPRILEAIRVVRLMRQGGIGRGDFQILDDLIRERYGSGLRVYNGIRLLPGR